MNQINVTFEMTVENLAKITGRGTMFIGHIKTGNLSIGDRIEIIWGQRKYVYEIYRAEDSTGIQDYEADLILYTCRLFNSPTRIFRYANRVN